MGAIRRTLPELTLWKEAPPEPSHIVDVELLRGIQGPTSAIDSESTLWLRRTNRLVIAYWSSSGFPTEVRLRRLSTRGGRGFWARRWCAAEQLLLSVHSPSRYYDLWAARSLTAPLTRFADAAERFTVGRADAPLSEEGPAEIRRAAVALNELRTRIRRLVQDRIQMLASIGHDP